MSANFNGGDNQLFTNPRQSNGLKRNIFLVCVRAFFLYYYIISSAYQPIYLNKDIIYKAKY